MKLKLAQDRVNVFARELESKIAELGFASLDNYGGDARLWFAEIEAECISKDYRIFEEDRDNMRVLLRNLADEWAYYLDEELDCENAPLVIQLTGDSAVVEMRCICNKYHARIAAYDFRNGEVEVVIDVVAELSEATFRSAMVLAHCIEHVGRVEGVIPNLPDAINQLVS